MPKHLHTYIQISTQLSRCRNACHISEHYNTFCIFNLIKSSVSCLSHNQNKTKLTVRILAKYICL